MKQNPLIHTCIFHGIVPWQITSTMSTNPIKIVLTSYINQEINNLITQLIFDNTISSQRIMDFFGAAIYFQLTTTNSQ